MNHAPICIGIDMASRTGNLGICIMTEENQDLKIQCLSTGLGVTQSKFYLDFGIGRHQRLTGKGRSSPFLAGLLKFIMDRYPRGVIALDVPFGWPTEFRDFIAAHKIGDPINLHERLDLLSRETDLEVYQQIGVSSNSVADKSSATRIEGARLLSELVRHGARICLGATSKGNWSVIETCPRATLAALIPDRPIRVGQQAVAFEDRCKLKNFKKRVKSSLLFSRLRNDLRRRFSFNENSMHLIAEALNQDNTRAFDSFLCALTAVEFSARSCFAAQKESLSTVTQEGCILYPRTE